MNILIIGAHPDDEVLGCGGLMNKLKKAENCVVQELIFSKGRSDQTDQRFDTLPFVDLIARIEDAVEATQADTVFTHHIGDLNRDHQLVAEATLVACRAQSGVKTIYSYFAISSSQNVISPFVPNTYIELTKEDVEAKKNAMRELYSEEIMKYPHPRSLESIELHARYFGTHINKTYAEPFNLIRRISYDSSVF